MGRRRRLGSFLVDPASHDSSSAGTGAGAESGGGGAGWGIGISGGPDRGRTAAAGGRTREVDAEQKTREEMGEARWTGAEIAEVIERTRHAKWRQNGGNTR
jgi:hypothetical protein